MTAEFRTGVQDGWHAIDPAAIDPGCTTHAWAACGAIVRVAGDEYQPYDAASGPVSYNPCQACLWAVAAETGTLDEAVARLPEGLARDAAAAIAAMSALDEDGETDPAVIQLLAAVARHAPVLLLSEECAGLECEHGAGDPCPGRPACPACSLQSGSWAGEWEGTFRGECTITAPCAVLMRIAAKTGAVNP